MYLDKLEAWMLSEEQKSTFHNDLAMLSVVWFGLEHLNSTVLRCEEAAKSQFRPDGQCQSPEVVQSRLLARCAFDWYAVSACNFVSLIGWIAVQAGLTKENQQDYLRRILPAVEIHRNKIAAHFARHYPKNDSEALQRASTMFFSLPLLNGRFVANANTLSIRSSGGSSDSSALQPWSVVDVHVSLRERYDDFETNPVGGLRL